MGKAKYRIEGEDATGAAFRAVLGNAKSTADKMSSVFRTAFAGISFAGIASLGRHAIEVGDDLEKFRIKARLSADSASSLAYAARLSDVELDALGTSLQKMQVFLSKAASGEELNVEGLEAIGLKLKAIRGLKADDQFELIADQISRMANEEDKTRAVTEIFGKSGAALLPLFQEGAAGIREAREEAEKLGLIFSEGELADLSAADDAIKRLDASWEHFASTMTAKVAPSITYALDRLAGKPKDVYEQIADQEDLIENLKYARGPNAKAQREAAQKRLNLLKQQALAQSSRDMGVMPQGSAPPPPPGYKPPVNTKEHGALERLSEQLADTMDRANEEMWKDFQDITDQETKAQLERIRIVTDAQKETEDELAEYRAQQLSDEYEARQEFLDELSYDLTDVFMRGGDGFEDMLKRWAADWLASDIRGLLGSLFGQNGPKAGSGGTGSSLFGWLGSLGGGGGGGASSFVPGEWDWMKNIGGGLGDIFGFANGGRPPVGRPSVVGEEGPELFVPDTAGTVLPNLGGDMNNKIEVHVHTSGGIQNSRQDGQRLGKIVADIVEDRIITKMRRRGYRLD